VRHVQEQQPEMVRSYFESLLVSDNFQIQEPADSILGGHLRPFVYSRISKYTKQFGLEAAVEVADFEFDHVPVITALVGKEKIDCDFTLTRSFDIYTIKDEAETAKKDYDEFNAAGIAKSTINDLVWTDEEHAEEASTLQSYRAC
jgi:hypothetical protein